MEYKDIHLEDGVHSQSVDSSTFIFISSSRRRGFPFSLAFPKINTFYKCRCGCRPGCRLSPTTEGIVIVAMSSFYSLPCFRFPPLNTLVKPRGRVFLSLYFLETMQKIYMGDSLPGAKREAPHFPFPQKFHGADLWGGLHGTRT